MITRKIGFSLLIAFILIGAGLASAWAANAELTGPEFPDRVGGVLIGLILALFSNAVAKRISHRAVCADRAAAKRFVGLTMVLAGLVYAGAYLFAPLELARWVGMGAVITALIAGAARLFSTTRGAQAGSDHD